jgi:hypothetical protein
MGYSSTSVHGGANGQSEPERPSLVGSAPFEAPMSDWISRQLDEMAHIREQERKAAAEAVAKARAERKNAWNAVAPMRQRAQAIADRLVADAHRLLQSRNIAPRMLAFTLYIHHYPRGIYGESTGISNKWVELGNAWCVVAPRRISEGYDGPVHEYDGLWIDEEGQLRCGKETRNISMVKAVPIDGKLTYDQPTIDTVIPRAIWYRPFDEVDSSDWSATRKLMPCQTETDRPPHCEECGPGSPFIFGPESKDPHENLLARQLVTGLQRLGAI